MNREIAIDTEARRGAWRGEVAAALADLLPVVVSAAPFALLLGSLAAQKGLGAGEVLLMSATVFAGGSQFVAIDLWGTPLAVAGIVLATLLVNLRHVLMGAAIAPHLAHWPRARAYGALFLLADEIWALSLRRGTRIRLGPVYYLALSVPLYLTWCACTTLGARFGHLIEDPAAWGFDFAFAAIFLCLLVSLWQGPRRGLPWVVSAAVAVAAHSLLPGVWYILLGAATGAAMGALLADPEPLPSEKERGRGT